MKIKKPILLLLGWLAFLLVLPLSAAEFMQMRNSKNSEESKIKVTLHYQNSMGNTENKKLILQSHYTTNELKKIIKKENLDVDLAQNAFFLQDGDHPIPDEEALKTFLGNGKRLHLYLKPTNQPSPLQSPETPKKKAPKITVIITHPQKKKNVTYTFAPEKTLAYIQTKISNRNPFKLQKKYHFVLAQQDRKMPYFHQKLSAFNSPNITLELKEKSGILVYYEGHILLIPFEKGENSHNVTIDNLLQKLDAKKISPQKILLGNKDLLKYKKKTLQELNITPENILKLTCPQIEIYDYTGKHHAPLNIKLKHDFDFSSLRTFIEKKWGYKDFKLTFRIKDPIDITQENFNTFKKEFSQTSGIQIFLTPKRDIKIRNPKAPKGAQEITIPSYRLSITPEFLNSALHQIKDPNDNKTCIEKTWGKDAYTFSFEGRNYNHPQKSIHFFHFKKEIITLVPYHFTIHIEGSPKNPLKITTLHPYNTYGHLHIFLQKEKRISPSQSKEPIFFKTSRGNKIFLEKDALLGNYIDTNDKLTLFFLLPLVINKSLYKLLPLNKKLEETLNYLDEVKENASKNSDENSIQFTLHYQGADDKAKYEIIRCNPNLHTTCILKEVSKYNINLNFKNQKKIDFKEFDFFLDNETNPIPDGKDLRIFCNYKTNVHLYLRQLPKKHFLKKEKEDTINVVIENYRKNIKINLSMPSNSTIADLRHQLLQEYSTKHGFTNYYMLEKQDGTPPLYTQKLKEFNTPNLTFQFCLNTGIIMRYLGKNILIPLKFKSLDDPFTVSNLLQELKAHNILPQKILLNNEDLLKNKKRTLHELKIIDSHKILNLYLSQIEICDYTKQRYDSFFIKPLDSDYTFSSLYTFIEKKWNYQDFRLTYRAKNKNNIEQSITQDHWDTFRKKTRQAPEQYQILVNPKRHIKILNAKAPKNAQTISLPYYNFFIIPNALHRALHQLKAPKDNKTWIEKTWGKESYTFSFKNKNYNHPQKDIPLTDFEEDNIVLAPYHFTVQILTTPKDPLKVTTLLPINTFTDLRHLLQTEKRITPMQSKEPMFLTNMMHGRVQEQYALGYFINTNDYLELFIPFHIEVNYKLDVLKKLSIYIDAPNLKVSDLRKKIEKKAPSLEKVGYKLSFRNKNYNNPEAIISFSSPYKEALQLFPDLFTIQLQKEEEKKTKLIKLFHPQNTFANLFGLSPKENHTPLKKACHTEGLILCLPDKKYKKIALKDTLAMHQIHSGDTLNLFIPYYIYVLYYGGKLDKSIQRIMVNQPDFKIKHIQLRTSHLDNGEFCKYTIHHVVTNQTTHKDLSPHHYLSQYADSDPAFAAPIICVATPYIIKVRAKKEDPWTTLKGLHPSDPSKLFYKKLIDKGIIQPQDIDNPLFYNDRQAIKSDKKIKELFQSSDYVYTEKPKNDIPPHLYLFDDIQSKKLPFINHSPIWDLTKDYHFQTRHIAATIQSFTLYIQTKGQRYTFTINPSCTTFAHLHKKLSQKVTQNIIQYIAKEKGALNDQQYGKITFHAPQIDQNAILIYAKKEVDPNKTIQDYNIPYQATLTLFSPYTLPLKTARNTIFHMPISTYNAHQDPKLLTKISNATGFRGQPVILGDLNHIIQPDDILQMHPIKPIKVTPYQPKLYLHNQPLHLNYLLKPTTSLKTIHKLLYQQKHISQRQYEETTPWMKHNKQKPTHIKDLNCTLLQLKIKGKDQLKLLYPFQIRIIDQRKTPNPLFNNPIKSLHEKKHNPTFADLAHHIFTKDKNNFNLFLKNDRIKTPKACLNKYLKENHAIQLKDFIFKITYLNTTKTYTHHHSLQSLSALPEKFHLTNTQLPAKVHEDPYIYLSSHHKAKTTTGKSLTKKNFKSTTTFAEAGIHHKSNIDAIPYPHQVNLSHNNNALTLYLHPDTSLEELQDLILNNYSDELYKDEPYIPYSLKFFKKKKRKALPPTTTLREQSQGEISIQISVK